MKFVNRRRFAYIQTTVLSFCLVLITSGALAQEFRNEAYAAETQPGIDHIYRMEYDEAIQFFTELEVRHPEHPGPTAPSHGGSHHPRRHLERALRRRPTG